LCLPKVDARNVILISLLTPLCSFALNVGGLPRRSSLAKSFKLPKSKQNEQAGLEGGHADETFEKWSRIFSRDAQRRSKKTFQDFISIEL
jgi:hypothetical protein